MLLFNFFKKKIFCIKLVRQSCRLGNKWKSSKKHLDDNKRRVQTFLKLIPILVPKIDRRAKRSIS